MTSIVVETCLGWIGVSCSEAGLTNIILPQNSRSKVLDLLRDCGESPGGKDDGYLSDIVIRLKEYCEGRKVEFPDKLDFTGATSLQKKVWKETRRIPYGRTESYGSLAKKIGCKSARAVGQALGKNPLPIVVPCHRVIGSKGKLVGFAAGLMLKEQLLRLEGAI